MTSTADLGVSVRSTCIDEGTELGCADVSFAGGTENLTVIVNGGDELFIIVQGWNAGAASDYTLNVATAVLQCGDGVVDPGEECDDGGNAPGDGCDENCLIELNVCGNTLLEPTNNEECDDGNTDPGDGCDANCLIEYGFSCVDPTLAVEGDNPGDLTGAPNTLEATCTAGGFGGPEQVFTYTTTGTAADTVQLDLGLTTDADLGVSVRTDCADINSEVGCADEDLTPGLQETLSLALPGSTDVVIVVQGYSAADEGAFTLNIASNIIVCGDGTVDTGEECDDGGNAPGDGCDENCLIELNVCGNGLVEPANNEEECDDGNTDPGDGCDANCLIEYGFSCVDPTLAVEGDNPGDLTGAPNTLEATCTAGGFGGPDAVFSYTVPGTAADSYQIDLDLAGDQDLGVSVRTDCADFGTEIDCADVGFLPGPQESTSFSAAGGTALAIIVQGYATDDTGPFVLTLGVDQIVCGDGNIDLGEECDDGGNAPGDGCDENCLIELNVCGNGLVEPANNEEECDDGNTVDNDFCDNNCRTVSPTFDLQLQSTPGLAFGQDPVTIQDVINNATVCDISLLSVDVAIAHTWRGDVVINLTSPAGTDLLLKAFDGDDNVADVVGNYPVTLTPVDDLAVLAGEIAVGDWTLTVSDTYPELDNGALDSWGLNIVCD